MIGLYTSPKWLIKFLGLEDKLSINCANYLRANGLLFHHTFNEGKRSRSMQEKLKGFGVMKGIPDLLIFHSVGPFVGLAVELKVVYSTGKKNVVSPSQKIAQKNLSQKRWKVVTVYSLDQFISEVKKYFKK